MTVSATDLPHLLYLADVPVEASYHGSVLVYRLLQDFPPKQLSIIEPKPCSSKAARRLPNVAYVPFEMGWGRLLHSRLADPYGTLVVATAKSRRAVLARLLGGFQPEAVLTVAHGYSWITAAAFAAERALPLHLILHDDWLHGVRILSVVKPQARRWFGEYYRQAKSRLCVSPSMVEKYQQMFGVRGTVLYPSRAADCPVYGKPPARISGELPRPVVAFAGTVNGPGYARALRGMADALAPLSGRLLIYGPLTQSQAEVIGLNQPNVELRGLVQSGELIARLRDEADILYVPMSFTDSDRINMGVGFPSKLADYTATGLPLLIHGPSYCSAVRWARENPGVAEVVEHEGGSNLRESVMRLCCDGSLRWQLGAEALEFGRKYFSHEGAKAVFLRSLQTT